MPLTAVIDQSRLDGGGLLAVLTRRGSTSTLELEGECDLAQREALHRVIGEALAARPESLVLDLRRLGFIDSSGVHIVVELAAQAREGHVQLVICPGPRAVQRVFEVCGLTSHLPFVEGAWTGAGAPRRRSAQA